VSIVARRTLAGALTTLALAGCGDALAPPTRRAGSAPSLRTSTSGVAMTDLGTLGGSSGEAKGINDLGQAVGWSGTAGGAVHAFLWTAADGMRDILPDLPRSSASVINANGQVAGEAYFADPGPTVFRWSDAEGVRDLGRVGCCSEVFVRGMNSVGQVVGQEWDEWISASNAFVWTEEQGMHFVPGVYPDYSWANGINDGGQVVGSDGGIAFVWAEGAGVRHIAGNANPSRAEGINNLGQIVGANVADWTISRAFLWTEAEGMHDLGTLGGTESVALAINAGGQVVGWSRVASGATHAFLWTAASGMRDLGTLPDGQSSSANGINALGQIVGSSTSASGESHAVLWTTAGAPPPPPPPNAPSTATARPVGSSSVAIAWSDNSTNEDGFRVQRSLDGGGSWTEIARTGPDVTSHDDGGRASEAQACYQVIAFSGAGESAPSNTACTTPPAAPTSLSAATDAVTPWSKVNLMWADNSRVEERYEIQRCTGAGCASYAAIATVAANTTGYSDATVAFGTTYGYRIRATKDGGGSDLSNAASATTDPDPNAAPAARYAWRCTNKSCTFDGTRSTDDAGITSYSWNFGDGATAIGPTVSHTYAARNTYTVKLTVQDNGTPSKSGSVACLVSATQGKSSGSCQ
jgi:probable HAF family extracellular repeat protein